MTATALTPEDQATASALRAPGELGRDLPAPVLAPCPFCGDGARVHEEEATDLDTACFTVFCKRLGCGSRVGFHDERADAIAAWNRRSDPVRAELLAALKDARNYVDAVVANSGNAHRRANYRRCVSHIDAAIAKATKP